MLLRARIPWWKLLTWHGCWPTWKPEEEVQQRELLLLRHPFDFTIGAKTLLRLDEFLLDCYPDQPEVLVYNPASEHEPALRLCFDTLDHLFRFIRHLLELAEAVYDYQKELMESGQPV